MFDKRTRASLMTLQSIKEQHGNAVWNAVIPIDTKFRDASLLHIPPSIYSPSSRGTYAYETLLNYLDAQERQRAHEVTS
jgi:chromosome partitioning protein